MDSKYSAEQRNWEIAANFHAKFCLMLQELKEPKSEALKKYYFMNKQRIKNQIDELEAKYPQLKQKLC